MTCAMHAVARWVSPRLMPPSQSRRLQSVLRAGETAAPPAPLGIVPKAAPAWVVSVLSHSSRTSSEWQIAPLIHFIKPAILKTRTRALSTPTPEFAQHLSPPSSPRLLRPLHFVRVGRHLRTRLLPYRSAPRLRALTSLSPSHQRSLCSAPPPHSGPGLGLDQYAFGFLQ